MSPGARGLAAALVLVAALGCESRERKTAAKLATLREGVVARVGPHEIGAETVARIARAQGVEPEVALERAVFDALVAAEAETRGLGAGRRHTEQAALARTLLEDLAREAREAGPATDDEIERFSEVAWFEVARPEAAQVVHAVVLVPSGADDAAWKRAEALAERVRQAVAPAANAARATTAPDPFARGPGGAAPPDPPSDTFVQLAKATSEGELVVKAERLDPVAADGLTVSPDGRKPLDPKFAEAVIALSVRGELTSPFRTSYGVHVAMLLTRTAGSRLDLEQRRRFFERDVIAARVRRKLDALLLEGRQSTSVEVERSADGLLGLVEVTK